MQFTPSQVQHIWTPEYDRMAIGQLCESLDNLYSLTFLTIIKYENASFTV